MSSKFNPPYNRRKPPPQCKKSEPVPDSPSTNSPVGSLAGQWVQMFWTWREVGPERRFEFRQGGYFLVDPFNTIVSQDQIDPDNYAAVVWSWRPIDQVWLVSCDLFYQGNFIATAINVPIKYRGGYPFSIGTYDYPVTNFNSSMPTQLTIAVTV